MDTRANPALDLWNSLLFLHPLSLYFNTNKQPPHGYALDLGSVHLLPCTLRKREQGRALRSP